MPPINDGSPPLFQSPRKDSRVNCSGSSWDGAANREEEEQEDRDDEEEEELPPPIPLLLLLLLLLHHPIRDSACCRW
jgi:hypothetical protein